MKSRNSSIEALRLFCILGILCMHLSGTYMESSNPVTLIQLNLINSLFNICVTCFILISGYFGLTRRLDKLFSLWCLVMFYSLSGAAFSYLIEGSISMTDLFKSVFPTITSKYWYFTTYVLLSLFAPYINEIPKRLSKKDFEHFLLLLISVFYLFPTFFFYEIVKDNGKGPVNMFIVYLIGRYIAAYRKDIAINKLKYLLSFFVIIFTAFAGNLAASLFRHRSFAPFARDNSLFMLAGAIALFAIIRNCHFQSKVINLLAKNILAVYVGEVILRRLAIIHLPLSDFDGKWLLLPVVMALAVLIMLSLSLIEALRKTIFHRLEEFITAKIRSSTSSTS